MTHESIINFSLGYFFGKVWSYNGKGSIAAIVVVFSKFYMHNWYEDGDSFYLSY